MPSVSESQNCSCWCSPGYNDHQLASETTFEICYLLWHPNLYLIICSFSFLFFFFKSKKTCRKSLLFPFFLTERKCWSISPTCWTVICFKKKGAITIFLLDSQTTCLHLVFKNHKARSNASNVQVSISNFTQTSDCFWMSIRVLRSAEGNLMLKKAHTELSSGPTCPVKEKNTQCYTAASAEDPSPRLRTATSLLFPDLVTDTV